MATTICGSCGTGHLTLVTVHAEPRTLPGSRTWARAECDNRGCSRGAQGRRPVVLVR